MHTTTTNNDRRMRRRLARAASVVLFLAAVWLAPGCGTPGPDGPADTYGLDFSLPPGSETHGAVVFVVDGVNADIFAEMLDAGELPAIRKYFADRGVYCPRAVANTPSVTLANLTSLATGRFPGNHGITGINWFDRNRLIWRNYETIAQKNTLDGDHTAPTIYEQFPQRSTFSVFFQPHRRTTKFIENWTSAGPPFYFGWYEFVDRLTLFRFSIVTDIARTRKEFPAVTFAYLLAPDFRAYAEGVSSQAYREALRHTDYQIGRVLGDMERAGLLDDITIALVSDHSLMDVRRHFPLEEFLRDELHMEIADGRLWEKTPFEDRLAYYGQYPAVLYGSGDRYWAICLRRPIRGDDGAVTGYRDWLHRPTGEELRSYPVRREVPRTDGWPVWLAGPKLEPDTADLPALLAGREEVDATAYSPAGGVVRLLRSTGEVEFRRRDDGTISYHVIEGDDPLGWRGKVADALLDGTPATGRRWLEETHDTDYPDLPAQILPYFTARRAGDIAVFAAPGWDLNDVNRAGHGGLHPGDMFVPLMLAGPGVPAGERIDIARTADLMPTLLHLLERPIPDGVDGQSLLP